MNIKHRANFPSMLIEMGLTGSAVEVGVYRGEFASHMLKHWPGRYYMIDSWWTKGIKQKRYVYNMIGAVVECLRISKPYEDRAFLLRMPSLEAAAVFKDASIDFVYIDADHSYEAVTNDIAAWYPKVRSGGVIAGHDYLNIDFDNLTEDIGFRKPDSKNVMLMQYVNDIKKIVPCGPYGANPAVDEFAERTGLELHLTEEDRWRSWYFIVP